MQAAILAKKMDNSTNTLLINGKSSKTSALGIRHREVCPSPSLNDVDGDEIEETNMDGDDTPSQFDQMIREKRRRDLKTMRNLILENLHRRK